VGPALSILAPSLHVNGQVELGRGQPGCSNCHGSSANAAPPLDLLGHADTGLVSVGAHQAHLRGLHRLRGPIACHSCHLVPTELNSPGHIDHPYPALVFPNGAASGGLEAAGGANPRWNRQTSTCSDVYCHGGGVLANDQATSIVRQPTWTSVGQGQAACGRCHGIPPADGGHLPSLTLRDCASCHPSVDGYGNVLFIETPGGSQSLHMDGQVDVL
jgi:predicted CxxxxCH...CXXCH cytochrome family protein